MISIFRKPVPAKLLLETNQGEKMGIIRSVVHTMDMVMAIQDIMVLLNIWCVKLLVIHAALELGVNVKSPLRNIVALLVDLFTKKQLFVHRLLKIQIYNVWISNLRFQLLRINFLRINFFIYSLNFRYHALMMSVDSCHSATETFQINSIEPGHLSSYMQGMSISFGWRKFE